MLKVNNKNTRMTSMKFGVFIVNFEHILNLFLLFVFENFQQVIFSWEDATGPNYGASCQIQNHQVELLTKNPP